MIQNMKHWNVTQNYEMIIQKNLGNVNHRPKLYAFPGTEDAKRNTFLEANFFFRNKNQNWYHHTFSFTIISPLVYHRKGKMMMQCDAMECNIQHSDTLFYKWLTTHIHVTAKIKFVLFTRICPSHVVGTPDESTIHMHHIGWHTNT